MPKIGLSFVLGALYIYMKSVNIYPKIAKYFDIEALENDAKQIDSTDQ